MQGLAGFLASPMRRCPRSGPTVFVVSAAGDGCALVGDEVFVDHVGQLPFQAAPGFCGGLGLGEFAAIVVAAGSGSGLGKRRSRASPS